MGGLFFIVILGVKLKGVTVRRDETTLFPFLVKSDFILDVEHIHPTVNPPHNINVWVHENNMMILTIFLRKLLLFCFHTE